MSFRGVLVAAVCAGLMLAEPVSAVDKILYLIRHGDSIWNKAGLVSKGWDRFATSILSIPKANPHWAHVGHFTDAPLSPKGIMDALSLCVDIYGENDSGKTGLCMNMVDDLKALGTNYAPEARNALREPSSDKAGAPTNADILSNAERSEHIQHYTSNLVRAIDTLFFAVYPSLVDGRVPSVMSTSYIQEIGTGWDASMHHFRTQCFVGGESGRHRACSKNRHDTQTESFDSFEHSEAFANAFCDLFNSCPGDEVGEHKRYYDSLEIMPRKEEDYFQFQHDEIQEDRASPTVYLKMYQKFLDLVAESDADYAVVAGHSHYFGHLLHNLGADDRCHNFGNAMQHNGAVWRVKLTSTPNDTGENDHMISECKIVYGRFKKETSVTDGYIEADMKLVLRRSNARREFEELDNLENDLHKLLGATEY